MKASDICATLDLEPTRGWKFLHALALNGLLTEENGTKGEDSAVFKLSPSAVEYFGANGVTEDGYFFRELVLFWRYLNDLDVPFVSMLKGADLPQMVQWPPKNIDTARHLEKWMTVTAQGAINTLLVSEAMAGAKTFLDVGGGDGVYFASLWVDVFSFF